MIYNWNHGDKRLRFWGRKGGCVMGCIESVELIRRDRKYLVVHEQMGHHPSIVMRFRTKRAAEKNAGRLAKIRKVFDPIFQGYLDGGKLVVTA